MSTAEDDAYELYRLSAEVCRAYEKRMAARLRQAQLPFEQYLTLRELARTPGQPMKGLAQATCVDAPTLSRIVDRMAARGLVYRLPDTRDRRSILVFASTQALELLKDVLETPQVNEAALVAALEQESVHRAALLAERLERSATPAAPQP